MLTNLTNKPSVKGFTLVELFVVIGIVLVLSVATITYVNPAQLIKKARDLGRITDMYVLNDAINFYSLDGGMGFGEDRVVYTSLPDTSQNCASYPDLPRLASSWSYHCVSGGDLSKADGTGWLPVPLISMSNPVLFELPIDPVNSPIGNRYYTYIKGSWYISAQLESAKYSVVANNDGGANASRFELGTNLALANVASFADDESMFGETLSGQPIKTADYFSDEETKLFLALDPIEYDIPIWRKDAGVARLMFRTRSTPEVMSFYGPSDSSENILFHYPYLVMNKLDPSLYLFDVDSLVGGTIGADNSVSVGVKIAAGVDVGAAEAVLANLLKNIPGSKVIGKDQSNRVVLAVVDFARVPDLATSSVVDRIYLNDGVISGSYSFGSVALAQEGDGTISFSVKDVSGSLLYSSVKLFSSEGNYVIGSSYQREHIFNVPPGKYFAVGYDKDAFFLRSDEFTLGSGARKEIVMSLADATEYKLAAYDIHGRAYHRKLDQNDLVIHGSSGSFWVGSFTIGGIMKTSDFSIFVRNLDKSVDIDLSISAGGSYEPECFIGRTWKCLEVSKVASETYYGGWVFKNAPDIPGSHIWSATVDAFPPREISIDARFDKKNEKGSTYLFEAFGSMISPIIPGSVAYFGTERKAYYPRGGGLRLWAWMDNLDDQRMGVDVFNLGNSLNERWWEFPRRSFDIGSVVGDAAYGSMPIRLGRLRTDGSRLEGDPYLLFGGQVHMDWSYPYRASGLDIEGLKNYLLWQTPSLFIYKDNLPEAAVTPGADVPQTGSLMWDVPLGKTYSYTFKPGEYRIGLDMSDIGAGHITQYVYFKVPSEDRSVPYVDRVEHPGYFLPGESVSISVRPVDEGGRVADVIYEYSHLEGAWITSPTVKDGDAYSTFFRPLLDTPISLRLTIEDDTGNKVEYTFSPLIKKGIGLNLSADVSGPVNVCGINGCTRYTNTINSVSCMDETGANCPNIALVIMCGSAKLRDWFYTPNTDPFRSLYINCNSDIGLSFKGSGAFMPASFTFPNGIGN